MVLFIYFVIDPESATAEQCSDNDNLSLSITSRAPSSDIPASTTNIPSATSITSDIYSDVPIDADPISHTTTQVTQFVNSSEHMLCICVMLKL